MTASLELEIGYTVHTQPESTVPGFEEVLGLNLKKRKGDWD
jgi:hypothetical protein